MDLAKPFLNCVFDSFQPELQEEVVKAQQSKKDPKDVKDDDELIEMEPL